MFALPAPRDCLTLLHPHTGTHLEAHQGQLQNVLCCKNCGTRRGNFEGFRELHLEVRGMSSMANMLDAFIRGEDIEGVECAHCNGKFTHVKVMMGLSCLHLSVLMGVLKMF
jgi:ubiquitin C-terminal hydrolase